MFNMFRSEPTGLEKARDDALAVLANLDPLTNQEDYKYTVKQIEKLSQMIAKEQPEQLNVNTLAMIAANLFIVLKVVRYEETNVVTTKVLPFLMKSI